MEETQFEERVTWGDDGTGHAGTIQAPNLEVMREETIEADQTEQQTNGQQGKNCFWVSNCKPFTWEEATIAVSSSGVHQTIGAYGNQLTPTTLLLSTNHLGQTQGKIKKLEKNLNIYTNSFPAKYNSKWSLDRAKRATNYVPGHNSHQSRWYGPNSKDYFT